MICVLNGVTWRTGLEHSTGAGDHVESVLHSAVCNDNGFKIQRGSVLQNINKVECICLV